MMYGIYVIVSSWYILNPYDTFLHGSSLVANEYDCNPFTLRKIESQSFANCVLMYDALNRTVDFTNPTFWETSSFLQDNKEIQAKKNTLFINLDFKCVG